MMPLPEWPEIGDWKPAHHGDSSRGRLVQTVPSIAPAEREPTPAPALPAGWARPVTGEASTTGRSVPADTLARPPVEVVPVEYVEPAWAGARRGDSTSGNAVPVEPVRPVRAPEPPRDVLRDDTGWSAPAEIHVSSPTVVRTAPEPAPVEERPAPTPVTDAERWSGARHVPARPTGRRA